MTNKNDNQRPAYGDEFDWADLAYFNKLTPAEKLERLEKAARALDQITPPEAKQAWRKLKETGF